MLDLTEDNAGYGPDFFVDLMFSEEAKSSPEDPENKDSFWKAIGATCAEKRRRPRPTAGSETASAESQPKPEDLAAFVIDETREDRRKSSVDAAPSGNLTYLSYRQGRGK